MTSVNCLPSLGEETRPLRCGWRVGHRKSAITYSVQSVCLSMSLCLSVCVCLSVCLPVCLCLSGRCHPLCCQVSCSVVSNCLFNCVISRPIIPFSSLSDNQPTLSGGASLK